MQGDLPPGKIPRIELPPGKLPRIELPPGKLPRVELPPGKLPRVELPPGKLPRVELPPGKLPPGKLPRIELPPGKLPRIELPPGKLPRIELPPGRLPLRRISVARIPAPQTPLQNISFTQFPSQQIVLRNTPRRVLSGHRPPIARFPPGFIPLGQLPIRAPLQPKIVLIDEKYASLFNSLIALAGKKSKSRHYGLLIRKHIQELVCGQMSPEIFVIRCHHIFGSYQPGMLEFLKREPYPPWIVRKNNRTSSFTSGSTETHDVARAPSSSSATPLMSPQTGPPILEHCQSSSSFSHDDVESPKNTKVTKIPIKRKNVSVTEENVPAPIVKEIVTRVTPIPSPVVNKVSLPKTIKILEPDDPLMTAQACLKHVNRRKTVFAGITQEAVNRMAEFVNVEFRVLMENVMNVAKDRQVTPLQDDESEEANDVKTQLKVLDLHYLNQDLKDSKSEEAKKLLASKNNQVRKREIVETNDEMSEAVYAALGKKPRLWTTSAVETKPARPLNPYAKVFRVSNPDVLFAMEKNKKLRTSWAYRTTSYVNMSASKLYMPAYRN